MRKIAIANRKGGVGKTTTAVNLSAGLALAGNTVLLIDTDTQGHCSRLLGVDPPAGLAELIEGSKNTLIEARERLFLLAGGKNLEGISRLISKESINPQLYLSRILKQFDGQYNFVIVDTAPGFNELNVNVLFYVSEVIVPVSLEVLSIEGLIAFRQEIERVQEYANISISHIVPTFADYRIKITEEILKQLKENFPTILTNPIHYSVKLKESPGWGKTIFEYSAKERVSYDYADLVGVINEKST